MDAETKDDWKPPQVDPETGVGLHGAYPLNQRLRAEALVKDGKATDPDGLVTDELIEDTRKRLDAEAADEAEQHPPVSTRMSRDDLSKIAQGEGVPVPDDATKSAIVDAINADRSADKEV